MIIQLHEVASDFKNLETISLWRPFIFRDHSLLETHLLLKTIQFWDSFPQVYFLETIPNAHIASLSSWKQNFRG